MSLQGVEGRAASTTARAFAVLAIAALATTASWARAQGVQVALAPGSQHVAPGAEFDLEIDVTQPGTPFNAYDAVLTFDPQALTFLPTSPPGLQEGSYMTGACGATFQRLAYAADSLVISHALLCNQVSLTGPGQLYRLHFRASTTPQQTAVRFRRVRFYNDGLYISPIQATDATITIGGAAWVNPAPGDVEFALASPWPNPTTGVVRVDFVVGQEADVRLDLLDVMGRRVARLAAATYPPGLYRTSWDGRREGTRLPAGVYLLRMEVLGKNLVRRLVLIP